MASTSTSRRPSRRTTSAANESVPRPGADSTPLSRSAVVEHALRVADLEGLTAVSIRRIAQDFDVTPMALYWHVKNKDELMAAMGDRILELAAIPQPAEDRGIDQLRDLLESLISALRQHPSSTELAEMRILYSDHGRQLAERALKVLRDSGFSVRQSADLARGTAMAAVTMVSGRPGAETTVPQDERESVLAMKRTLLAELPTDRFPHLVECAEALIDCGDEAVYYENGIDLFMAGVRTLARQSASAGG